MEMAGILLAGSSSVTIAFPRGATQPAKYPTAISNASLRQSMISRSVLAYRQHRLNLSNFCNVATGFARSRLFGRTKFG
jgi:hypothetical protein